MPDLSRGMPTAGEWRGMALAALDRAELLPDESRQAAALNLEADDDPTGRLALLTVELSNPEYRSAFMTWMGDPESGHYTWTPEQRDAVARVKGITRAMSLGTPGAGGFLVPYELDPNIILAGTGSVDPMRRVARVVSTAYNEKRFVTSLGVTASIDAEATEVSDDTPTLLQPSITCHKGQVFVPVSFELFDDSDIAAEVGKLFADAKLQLESTLFTLGSGSGQPKGVITAVSAVGGSVIATGTNTLAQDDLYNNQSALPPRWRPRARWMMNLSILNGYRQKIKGTGLTESIVDDSGQTPRILGCPVSENSVMDGALTAAANDFTVLSGDFQQYAIVDRIGTVVSFIPHLFGPTRLPTGQHGFHMYWRFGADVLIPDAFRLTNHNS